MYNYINVWLTVHKFILLSPHCLRLFQCAYFLNMMIYILKRNRRIILLADVFPGRVRGVGFKRIFRFAKEF